jgi:hypothetical protein
VLAEMLGQLVMQATGAAEGLEELLVKRPLVQCQVDLAVTELGMAVQVQTMRHPLRLMVDGAVVVVVAQELMLMAVLFDHIPDRASLGH